MDNITSAIVSLAERHFGDFKIRRGEIVPRYCPFCGGGDNKDRETFSIGMYNGLYNCKRGGCDKKGDFKDICEYFGERMINVYTPPKTAGTKKKIYDKPNPSDLRPITEDIETYFALRKIGIDTLEAFKIASDDAGNIVFPFYREGNLTYVKYRKPKKHTKEDGPKEWQMANTEPILFGMDNVSKNLPLIITEGEIDALSIYEAGYSNVVSVPCGCNNLEWITLCWDWLNEFNQIILFGDSDEPGREMISTVMKRLGEDKCKIPPDYPDFITDEKDFGRPCKDANEILYAYGPEGIKSIIERCENVPIKGILNLASVPFVDPTTIPRIYTRIPSLDNAIGGLSEGGLYILSGRRGEGKSTIGGSLLLNAIQQGYKCCAYSGELPASKFLEWIMCQATERKYIEAKIDEHSGKQFAVVPFDIQSRIRDWIDEKFFLFDNGYSPDIPQEEAIINIFTSCAKQYGAKVFLVDNLLTILSDADGADENRIQAKFVAALKSFAVKFKASVILVAHPRKSAKGETFSSESVAGSGNITNLADVVMSVEKPNIRVNIIAPLSSNAYRHMVNL